MSSTIIKKLKFRIKSAGKFKFVTYLPAKCRNHYKSISESDYCDTSLNEKHICNNKIMIHILNNFVYRQFFSEIRSPDMSSWFFPPKPKLKFGRAARSANQRPGFWQEMAGIHFSILDRLLQLYIQIFHFRQQCGSCSRCFKWWCQTG